MNLEKFEKAANETYFQLIDKNICMKKRIIGYCRFSRHRGYITKKLYEAHDCRKKKCPLFVQVNKNYWNSQKVPKEKSPKKIQAIEVYNKQILEYCSKYKKLMHVTAIREVNKEIIVHYVSLLDFQFNTKKIVIPNGAPKYPIRFKRVRATDKVIDKLCPASAVKEHLALQIKENLVKIKSFNTKKDAEEIKQLLIPPTFRGSVSITDFTEAMVDSGYNVRKSKNGKIYYNISAESPLFKIN